MGETYAIEQVLPRMARLVGEGTGARRSEVWLRIGAELRSEASWPETEGRSPPLTLTGDRPPDVPDADRAEPVLHQGELLGMVTVAKPRGESVTAAEEKLIAQVASQAGLVLRNVRLIEDLQASRQRLVTAQDEERRRLERNIHDGAQQQLVALTVKMRLVQAMAGRDPAKAAELADQAKSELQDALDDLRDLARGIYPPLLADQGLATALEAQARKAAVPVEVHPDGIGRYPQDVEAGAYFCVLEALQNVAKYSGASRVKVSLRAENGHLVFEVNDDGRGFDPTTTPKGSGLTNMRDRLEALGGSVEVASRPGEGTAIRGRIPVPNGGTA
jgi:signal transduction histidine kinase